MRHNTTMMMKMITNPWTCTTPNTLTFIKIMMMIHIMPHTYNDYCYSIDYDNYDNNKDDDNGDPFAASSSSEEDFVYLLQYSSQQRNYY